MSQNPLKKTQNSPKKKKKKKKGKEKSHHIPLENK
jgi:hypothetical protein